MENLKPNEQRGKMAVAMIWIVMSLHIIMGISNYFEYRLLSDADAGEIITMEAATANDTRQQLIAIVVLVAYLVSIVTFILWFRRAYYNLHLRVNHLQNSEGWAAGCWFVPIVNLYMPYQIMKELYVETYVLVGCKKGNPENFSTVYVGLWWAFWLFNAAIDRVDFSLSMSAKSITESINSSMVSMVSCGFGIRLALLSFKVVSDYMQMEKRLALPQNGEPEIDAIAPTDDTQNGEPENVTAEPLL